MFFCAWLAHTNYAMVRVAYTGPFQAIRNFFFPLYEFSGAARNISVSAKKSAYGMDSGGNVCYTM